VVIFKHIATVGQQEFNIKTDNKNYMRLLILFLFLTISYTTVAQTEATGDTTIYNALMDMPRFPGCESLDTTMVAKKECAQRIMLAYIYQNINYPLEARSAGVEGKVVVSFVIEKDGTVTNAEVLKDIGGGCGPEALRVINQMTPDGIRWVPGLKDGKPVRTRKTLPISFKLQEQDPFIVMGGDSVWVITDTPLAFEGGGEALAAHINDNLKYPDSGRDSCLIGDMDIKLKVDREGQLAVLELIDYNNLGFDFWYEATNAATSTIGKWQVATYDGAKVPSAYEFVVTFLPDDAHCTGAIENYNKASKLAAEGVTLFNEEKVEEALTKMGAAIELFEGNANFHYLRGQMYLSLKRYPEACEDLQLAKEIAQLSDFDSILSIICN
jgi:TonB family protein